MSIRSNSILGGTLAALLVSATGGPVAAQEFESGGWKGYRADEDPDRGCRMAKRVGNGLHLVVYASDLGGLGIGAVDADWGLATGEPFDGLVRFDRGRAYRLSGAAENAQMVVLYPDPNGPDLEAALIGAGEVELSVGDILIDTDLRGTTAALDNLYGCAAEFASEGGLGTSVVAESRQLAPAPSNAVRNGEAWANFSALGLSVDYPAYLVEDVRDLVDERGVTYGATFVFELGDAYMHAWVADHAGSPYSYVIDAGGAQRTVTYRVDKASLGVWSGYEGDDIFYDMCKRAPGGAGDRLHCFRLYYPTQYREIFDPVVERAARSLR